jgi:hypothetical protein
MFVRQLLAGASAGVAFEEALVAVDSDPRLAQHIVLPGELPPRDKFQIREAGRAITLPVPPAAGAAPGTAASPPVIRRDIPRRTGETFAGRWREMADVLELLLPLPPGISRPGGAGRRILTLTREGGIGKTSLAAELADWVAERGLFPGGVCEAACERFREPAQLLTRLLTVFGVAPEMQRGDLHDLLGKAAAVRLTDRPALLILDNLDDLTAKERPDESRRQKTLELNSTARVAASLD